MEANIIKARLEDSGFACFLSDENVATINPLYNQAIGGVKLHVFERDVEAIDALLAEEGLLSALPAGETEGNTGEERPAGDTVTADADAEAAEAQTHVHCPRCGSDDVSFGQATKKRFSWWVTLVSLLLSVYPFKANQCYHCYNCGCEFN